MNKTQISLTSLVAALPGAFLAYLMVMAFLNFAGGWSIATKGLAGLFLLIGAGLAFTPVALFVLAGPKAPKAPKEEKPKEEELEAVSDAGEAVSAAEVSDGEGLEPAEEATEEAVEETAEEEPAAEAAEFDDAETLNYTPDSTDTAEQEFDLGDEFETDDEKKEKE